MLERIKHKDAIFITLTYKPEKLPDNFSLNPDHTQSWIKRLRQTLKREYQVKVRYFLVGEYGDESQLPHYHVALFGFSQTMCITCKHRYRRYHHGNMEICDCVVHNSWGFGHVFVGDITFESASYVAGYVTKKLTNERDQEVREKLAGRKPEFARMSLKPGIGALAVSDIAKSLNTMHGAQLVLNHEDVPSTLMWGGSEKPLGSYLVRKLRKEMGYDEEMLKSKKVGKWSAEIAEVLRENGIYSKGKTIKEVLLEVNRGKVEKKEARYRIYKKRRSI